MSDQIQYYEGKLAFEIDSWDLLQAQKAGENVVALDARAESLHATKRIPGAVSFPHRRMTPENTAHLSRDAVYVVYCDGIGCNASTQGALKMARLGFKAKELIGGLDWWERSGFPTEGAARSRADAGRNAAMAAQGAELVDGMTQ